MTVGITVACAFYLWAIKIYILYAYKRAKKMPEESGVGTVAEWSVPSSGIKKEVSVKTFFGVFLSSFSCNYFEYCFWLLFFLPSLPIFMRDVCHGYYFYTIK